MVTGEGKPMRVRSAIMAVGAAVVLALGALAPSQAAGTTGPEKPVKPDLSIPAGTTLAELATSEERLKLLDDLRDAAAADPQRYGGVDTNGDANIWLCDNGSGPEAAVDTPVAALRATGATVTIKTCARNLNDLNKVLNEVATSTVFSSNSVVLTRWGIEYGRNAVQVGVDTIPPGFADKVTALWGDAVYLWIPPTEHLQSRTNDTAPFYGGDYITAGITFCTSGFTLTNAYGTRYAITAGHCFSSGTLVANGGHSMGTVDFRQWGGGAMDNELIGGGSYAGIIFIGGAGSAGNTMEYVGSAANSCTGCYVYENGTVTGQSKVMLTGSTYCDNVDSHVSCNVQGAFAVSGKGCQEGDSGNPVFAYSGTAGVVIAVGIHHAGNEAEGYCSYTPLPPILSYWQATITTS